MYVCIFIDVCLFVCVLVCVRLCDVVSLCTFVLFCACYSRCETILGSAASNGNWQMIALLLNANLVSPFDIKYVENCDSVPYLPFVSAITAPNTPNFLRFISHPPFFPHRAPTLECLRCKGLDAGPPRSRKRPHSSPGPNPAPST